MTLISPAVSMMARLRYPYKFTVISLIFLLPMMAFFYVSVSGLQEKLRTSELELKGTELLFTLRPLVENFAKHRGMSNALLNGDQSFADKVISQRAIVDGHIQAMLDFQFLWTQFELSAEAQQLADDWRQLKSATNLSASMSFQRHTELIDEVLTLKVQVADSSHLSLDPEMTTYYLMDAVVNRLPVLVENLGQVRGKASGVAAQGRVSTTDGFSISSGLQKVRATHKAFRHGLHQIDINGGDRVKSLVALADSSEDSLLGYLRFVDQQVLAASALGGIEVEPASVFSRGTAVIVDNFKIYDQSLQMLQMLLEQRIQQGQ